ncbi:DUF4038 domain-containing protein [Candidatus Microgenomates bacterium]|jgi:hypothetical protein|nr:MAG: DUF4038 domain-containing protein [Candidatus Microgenomates bacterium]
MNNYERPDFKSFLSDTWWYGLTKRVSDEKFEELAKLRARQGFTAVQIVAGIPPEVGPENPNASSYDGPAWNLKGEFNQGYLERARERVKLLNSLGLSAILYGAWGQQIEWIGEERMKGWWNEIVKNFNDLDVMYCLTGESDIWIGEEGGLLPNKSTGELNNSRLAPFLHPRFVYLGRRLINLIDKSLNKNKKTERKAKWSRVLAYLSLITDKPIFIHVLPGITSEEAVGNPQLLDAITVQTGHDVNTRWLLWELPLENRRRNPRKPFINLEPWYEGIMNRFETEDQMYAYWASMMAGAYAYCYGAHGIWNAGDGEFLAHWGTQTIDEAMKLKTPYLLGISHKLFNELKLENYTRVEVREKDGELIEITRSNGRGDFVSYIPDISLIEELWRGDIFLPTEGEFVKSFSNTRQVVIIFKQPGA